MFRFGPVSGREEPENILQGGPERERKRSRHDLLGLSSESPQPGCSFIEYGFGAGVCARNGAVGGTTGGLGSVDLSVASTWHQAWPRESACQRVLMKGMNGVVCGEVRAWEGARPAPPFLSIGQSAALKTILLKSVIRAERCLHHKRTAR